ncbi:hypothetical protein BSR42_12885 [Megasphaera cerevisiae]|nr:hypothetical protein BSR42_12885 [Megasphaera cerevisiae]
MNETSMYAATGTASRWQWKFGPDQRIEWIREMRPERRQVGCDGVFPPLSKKHVSPFAVHAEMDSYSQIGWYRGSIYSLSSLETQGMRGFFYFL